MHAPYRLVRHLTPRRSLASVDADCDRWRAQSARQPAATPLGRGIRKRHRSARDATVCTTEALKSCKIKDICGRSVDIRSAVRLVRHNTFISGIQNDIRSRMVSARNVLNVVPWKPCRGRGEGHHPTPRLARRHNSRSHSCTKYRPVETHVMRSIRESHMQACAIHSA
jgi:hypothetical protein